MTSTLPSTSRGPHGDEEVHRFDVAGGPPGATAAGDPERWPAIVRPPRAPVSRLVARKLFTRVVSRLAVQVLLPDGSSIGRGGPGCPQMSLVRPDAFFARLGAGGLIGFGEAWMAGDWDAADPVSVLTPFAERMASLVPARLQGLRRFYDRRHPEAEENTIAGARRNISRHYDLSNDFFALFLDETLSYSAGLFSEAPGARPWPSVTSADPLVTAQHRKIDRLLDLTRVGPGSRVLEIGTGWGELALRAAGRGAQVTTVTLSREQRALAQERLRAAGLAERVDVQLRDYREVRGRYDAVLSVEMVEAVGYRHWPTYFAALDAALTPGGRVGIQAITMPHDRLLASRDSYTWIHKYVFPGGLLPSVTAIEEVLARHTTLRIVDDLAMGADYASTLRLWRQRFLDRRPDARALGFDPTFLRMWEFYLAYCEAGFRARYLDVHQFVLARGRP